MARSYWKSGAAVPPKKQLAWPSAGQAILQIAIAGVIGLVWLGLLAGYIGLSGGTGFMAASAAETEADEPVDVAEEDQTPTPTRRM